MNKLKCKHIKMKLFISYVIIKIKKFKISTKIYN